MYGMSYDEYWNGDPRMTLFFYEKQLLIRRMHNEEMWINGAYTLNALTVALSNALSKTGGAKYPQKPFDIFKKTEIEKELERMDQRRQLVNHLEHLKTEFNKKHQKTGVDHHDP